MSKQRKRRTIEEKEESDGAEVDTNPARLGASAPRSLERVVRPAPRIVAEMRWRTRLRSKERDGDRTLAHRLAARSDSRGAGAAGGRAPAEGT